MLEILKIRKDINWLIEQIKCLIRKSDLDSPLAATEWSPNHSVALGNPYILDCFVWFNGHIYRSLIDNNVYAPTNDCYWEDLGEGHLLLEEQSNWNATTGRAFIRNKPDLSQYALDANVVHKTGNETIDGIKTFIATVRVIGVKKVFYITDSDLENGSVIIGTDVNNLPFIQLGTNGGDSSGEIRIDNVNTNNVYQLPSLSGTLALDENLVHKTGDEIIDGIKTFVKDIIVNNIFVGRGEGDYISNTALGYRVLLHNTTGVENTAIGSQALRNNIIGIRNTAVGEGALKQNLVDENTAVGHGSLQVNTSGAENTAVGALALNSNIIGSGNTAVGLRALKDNLSSDNTAVGKEALRDNKQGFDNVAIGERALQKNVNGKGNIGIGKEALNNIGSYINAQSDYNTVIGMKARSHYSSGSYNVGIGAFCLENSSGSQNVAVGVYALERVSGGYNVAVGNKALYESNNANYNVGVGAFALEKNKEGFYNVAIGYNALGSEEEGNGNIGIGKDCRIIGTNVSNAIVIGTDARGLGSNTTVIGNDLTTLTELRGGLSLPEVRNLNFVDDAAAALGGVPIDAIYHNAGILRIRLV